MADSLGFLSKAGFRKDRGLYGGGPAIAYPQVPGGSDIAATHQLPFTDDGMTKGIERLRDPALLGAGIPQPSDILTKNSAGALNGLLRWRGWERLMLCAMGFEHPAESPHLLAGTAYTHLFELDEDLQDRGWIASEIGAYVPPSVNDRVVRRGMLGLAKQTADWVWESAMVNKMTISSNAGEPVKISFDLVGYDLVRGSYNSANWTLPSGSFATALHRQAVVSLGIRSAGVGGLVVYAPSSWELTVDNKLKTDDRTTTSGANIVQPVRSDFRDVSLKISFPRWYPTLEGFLTVADLDLELAGSIIITGPVIGATAENYKYDFFMSSLRYKNPVQSIPGAGPLVHSFELEAHRPGGSDIFTAGSYHGITLKKDSELVLMIQNETTTNYLIET